MSKGKTEAFQLTPSAAEQLAAALEKIRETELRSAVQDLGLLAYMLEKKRNSKGAARAILGVAESVLMRRKPNGWAKR